MPRKKTANGKILVMIIGFIVLVAPLVLLSTTNSYISAIENLDTPEAPEINNLSDLSKLNEYKSNVIDYVLINVFGTIFEVVTGSAVLETLKGIQFFLSLIVLVEIIIIALVIYYGVCNR